MPWLLRMTLLVSALMLPPVLYLTWRLTAVIQNSEFLKSVRWHRAVLVFLFSFYLLPLSAFIDWSFSGDIDLLKYPPPVMYWFWFGLVFCYHLVTWVLLADLAKLAGRWFAGGSAADRYHSRAVLLLFPLILLFTGTKMYVDTTGIRTERQTLEIENLPPALEGFRIIHISDIQGDEFTGREKIAGYIDRVNEEEGDLIIFTGDLISYGTEYIGMSAAEFGKVRAGYGTAAVVGDHDYWAGTDHIERALTDAEIPLLQNENMVVQVDSTASVLITGVVEVYSRRSPPEETEKLMRSGDGYSLKILASHQVVPHLVEKAGEQGYRLLLGGHTHGGQVLVPFLGMSFSASERETEYVSGSVREKGVLVNINNGLGFTLAPVRYGAKPNISVIELRGKGN